MKKQYYLTKEGVEELKTELADLVGRRSAIAERIKSAREFGDLTENAEYTSARQEQERTEGRISEIEHILLNVDIIKKPRSDSAVSLGCSVKLKSKTGDTKEFQVVGTVEADPLNGKISNESPIGRALMGKKVGEEVEIKANSSTTIYTITAIS